MAACARMEVAPRTDRQPIDLAPFVADVERAMKAMEGASPPGTGSGATSDRGDDFMLLQELVKGARERLPRAVWDYVIGGADTETTLRRNRQGLDSLALRPRVLRDVSEIDCSGTLLGVDTRLPVLLAPIGSLQDLDPGGGASAARAAGEFGVFHMQSSASAPGLEDTAKAGRGPKIFQLYVRGDEAWVSDHLRRAAESGYHAVGITVDLALYSRRERDLAKRHVTSARRATRREDEAFQARLSWRDIERIRGECALPLILKGIATAEDASLACELGIDAVYVSNHGGRQLDHGRASIDVLPEVVDAVAGRAEVIVDGAFLRGSDLVKAIARGAGCVGVGRLLAFAIAAGGAPGVVRMLELLEEELRICLGLLGVERLDQLDESHLHPATPVAPAHALSAFPLLEERY